MSLLFLKRMKSIDFSVHGHPESGDLYLLPDADRLPKTSRRSMNKVEGGMAALISSTLDSQNPDATVPRVIQSRMFSTLPLPISLDLPVQPGEARNYLLRGLKGS